MKFALALFTALAMVAASPVPSTLDARSEALEARKEGKTNLPAAVPGQCKKTSCLTDSEPCPDSCCPSGNASCSPGWGCYASNGLEFCIPPGYIVDEHDSLRRWPTPEVDVMEKFGCDGSIGCNKHRCWAWGSCWW